MKIDTDYIQQILKTMEDHSGHQISNFEVMSQVDAGMTIYLSDSASNIINDRAQLDKFIGHIKHLYDQGLIDCNNPNLGVARHMQGYSLFSIEYRLTNDGHDYLASLKQNKVTFKFKEWLFSFVQKIWGHIESSIAAAIAAFCILIIASYFGWEWLSND